MNTIQSTVEATLASATAPEKMRTIVCSSCRMALYLPDRKLQMPSWKCPSCGTITRVA